MFSMIQITTYALIVILSISIPYQDQILLANSLIVGRNDLQSLQQWQCKVCDSSNKPIHIHFIQNIQTDIKCAISVYQNFIVLAFRYTNTALNVWQDILYPIQIKDKYACQKCKVQKAYNNMWQGVKEEVFSYLKILKQQTEINKLYLTGISLGGGLAVISYIDIHHFQLFENIRVVTFGAPRVGNKHWAAHFDLITSKRTFRYVVKGDPIVAMPYCLTLLCTYRQTGIQIVCDQKSQQCIQQNQISNEQRFSLDSIYNPTFKALKFIKEQNLKNLMDHINGYPKIYNSTLILKK